MPRRLLWAVHLLVLGVALLLDAAPGRSQETPDCASWADLLVTHCPEEVIHDEDFLLAYCQHPDITPMPAGNPVDTGNNTLGCRIHWAEAARDAPDEATRLEHCKAAAITGGDVCGSFCDVYCHVALETCNDINNPDYPQPNGLFQTGGGTLSRPQCLSACSGYSEDVLDDISQTDQAFGYGDTVQCRNHHLQAAVVEGQSNPSKYQLHCSHANVQSTVETCSASAPPNTVNYCAFAIYHCTDLSEPFFESNLSHAACVSMMGGLVQDGIYREEGFESFVDTDTNSLGCLNNRIMLAAMEAETYCGQGSYDVDLWVPDGEAVCVASSTNVPIGSGVAWGFPVAVSLVGLALLLYRRVDHLRR